MHFVQETSLGLFYLLLRVFLIVVPLMVILEVSRSYRLIDRLTGAIQRPAAFFGYGRDSIYPLLAGVIFGISYGGGVLIGESDSGRIRKNQRFLVALYLGLCHAVFEDTLIFVSLGANGVIVLTSRLLLASLVVFCISILLRRSEDRQEKLR